MWEEGRGRERAGGSRTCSGTRELRRGEESAERGFERFSQRVPLPRRFPLSPLHTGRGWEFVVCVGGGGRKYCSTPLLPLPSLVSRSRGTTEVSPAHTHTLGKRTAPPLHPLHPRFLLISLSLCGSFFLCPGGGRREGGGRERGEERGKQLADSQPKTTLELALAVVNEGSERQC